MVIRIFLLQHPHIEIDGREAFLKLNKKSLAMICYLVARQGQTVSRELLSEIFWPEQRGRKRPLKFEAEFILY